MSELYKRFTTHMSCSAKGSRKMFWGWYSVCPAPNVVYLFGRFDLNSGFAKTWRQDSSVSLNPKRVVPGRKDPYDDRNNKAITSVLKKCIENYPICVSPEHWWIWMDVAKPLLTYMFKVWSNMSYAFVCVPSEILGQSLQNALPSAYEMLYRSQNSKNWCLVGKRLVSLPRPVCIAKTRGGCLSSWIGKVVNGLLGFIKDPPPHPP